MFIILWVYYFIKSLFIKLKSIIAKSQRVTRRKEAVIRDTELNEENKEEFTCKSDKRLVTAKVKGF